MAAKIPLTNSAQMVLVDDEDYKWAIKHSWRLDEDGHIVRDGDRQKGEPAVVYMCNEVLARAHGVPLSHFGPPRPLRPRPWRVRRDEWRPGLRVGDYEQEIVAALAYDLVARAVGHEPEEYNFKDGTLRDLVPVDGDDAVRGLSPDVTDGLCESIEHLIRKFSRPR